MRTLKGLRPAVLLILNLVALGFLCPRAQAQGARFYGDLSAVFSQARWNEHALGAQALEASPGMATSLLADLAFSVRDEALGLFFLNAYVVGALNNLPSAQGTQVAPLSLAIGQCYAQVPLGSAFMLSFGKRNKSMGYASFFNVSNRLTPRSLGGVGDREPAMGLVELDAFLSEVLTIEALGYASELEAWEDVSAALALKLQLNAFNLDLYGYLEELEHPALGWNAALQLGRLKVYGEGLVAARSQQRSLVELPVGTVAEDFVLAERTSIQQALGVELPMPKVTVTLEYLYRSEGPDAADRQRLVDYVEGLAEPSLKAGALGLFYRARAFDSHYLALLLNSSLIPELLDSRLGLHLSAGEEAGDWDESLGTALDYSVTVKPVSNFTVTMFLSWTWGGALSESALFSERSLSGGLACTYGFASKQ